MDKMVKPIMKDIFFLGQKSEPATKADLQVGRDLMDGASECKSAAQPRRLKRSIGS